jgi:putative oxidoreductase
MPALITLGRVLFALPFIYSGATKLFGIQPTADFIAAVIPSFIIPYTSQLEAMTAMSTPQILAIAVGMFEVASVGVLAPAVSKDQRRLAQRSTHGGTIRSA